MADPILELPQKIADYIEEVLPQLAVCQTGEFGNIFEYLDQNRRPLAAPAVLVTLKNLRHAATLSEGVQKYHARIIVFILTETRQNLPRDTAARAMAGALLRAIPQKDFGCQKIGVGPAGYPDAEMIFNKSKGKSRGLCVFAMAWDQPFVLGDAPTRVFLDPALYVGHAPKIGPEHKADYERIDKSGCK